MIDTIIVIDSPPDTTSAQFTSLSPRIYKFLPLSKGINISMSDPLYDTVSSPTKIYNEVCHVHVRHLAIIVQSDLESAVQQSNR